MTGTGIRAENVPGERWRRAAGVAQVFALLLFALAAAVTSLAGNGALLSAEMHRHAPPESTGLPAAEYDGVGRMITAYLTGGAEEFQYTFADENGRIYRCFQPHEAAHMVDVRGLIRLAETLRWISGGLVLILVSVWIGSRGARRAAAKGWLWGLRIAGVLAAALIAWGLIDFDSLFTAFHRLAFDNEGWLLDPRTDLLIRLMPVSFFVSLALRALAGVLGTALAADLAVRAYLRADAARAREERNRYELRGSFPPAGGKAANPDNGAHPGTGDQL